MKIEGLTIDDAAKAAGELEGKINTLVKEFNEKHYPLQVKSLERVFNPTLHDDIYRVSVIVITPF